MTEPACQAADPSAPDAVQQACAGLDPAGCARGSGCEFGSHCARKVDCSKIYYDRDACIDAGCVAYDECD